MKKKKIFTVGIPLLLALVLTALSPLIKTAPTASAAWNGTVASVYYSSGSGTVTAPYIISTPEQLAKLASVVNGGTTMSGIYFELNADLDLGNVAWTPIGTNSNKFQGSFNGKNHTISNLWVSMGSSSYGGLFGVSLGSTFRSLTINNTTVSGSGGRYGALCGKMHDSDAYYINITGKVNISGSVYNSGSICVGGLAGQVHTPTTFSGCNINASTSSLYCYQYVGGFVGDIRYESSGSAVFRECSVNGITISQTGSDESRTGGFFGDIDKDSTPNVSFSDCMVTNSSVSGTKFVGGFGFYLRSGSTITSCGVYNTAVSVYGTGSLCAGGFLGSCNGTVINSYASPGTFKCSGISSVALSNYVGSFVGEKLQNAATNDCYVTPVTVTLSSGTATLSATGGGAANTVQSKTASTVASGELSYVLNDEANGYYWNQKDNNSKHIPGTTLCTNVGTYPIPGTAANATRQYIYYGSGLTTNIGSCPSKFNITLDNTNLNNAYLYNTRQTLYMNGGRTLTATVSKTTEGEGYIWYLKVGSTVYADQKATITLPAADAVINLCGEKEAVYSIRYFNGNTGITSSVTGPKEFSKSNPANLSGVTYSKSKWAFTGWKDANGNPVTTVSTSSNGYGMVTLYAQFDLETETGTDGKQYKKLYTFDHLERFADRVNAGETLLNAKLYPQTFTYPTYKLTIKAGSPVFTPANAYGNSFKVNSSSEKTCAIVRAIHDYTGLPALDIAGALSSNDADFLETYADEIDAANYYVDSLGMRWGTYKWTKSLKNFAGTFDGNNATVSGVTYGGTVSVSNNKFGLFYQTINGAVIKNLTLSGGTFTLTSASQLSITLTLSPLVSDAYGSITIQNCVSSVPINTSGVSTSSTSYIGGLIGRSSGGAVTIDKCAVTGAINSGGLYGYISGLLGYSQYGTTAINNSYVRANITSATETPTNVSGIAATAGSVNNCYYYGTLTAAQNAGTGAYPIVTPITVPTVTNCYYVNTCGFNTGHGTAKSPEEFTNGNVAFLLQGENAVKVWGQTSLTGTYYPILSSLETTRVRCVTNSDGTSYYNIGTTMCDANEDNTIDINDYSQLVNAVLTDNTGSVSITNVDINSDGVLDAIDVVLFERVLSGHATPSNVAS